MICLTPSLRHSVTSSLAFSFPYADWQFWAVTLITLAAAAWLLRGLRPGRKRRRTQRRVSLTVSGKSPHPPADRGL